MSATKRYLIGAAVAFSALAVVVLMNLILGGVFGTVVELLTAVVLTLGFIGYVAYVVADSLR